jgi:hypothetical protein
MLLFTLALFPLLLICLLLICLLLCRTAEDAGFDFANIHIFSVLHTGSSEIIMYGTYYHGYTVDDYMDDF